MIYEWGGDFIGGNFPRGQLSWGKFLSRGAGGNFHRGAFTGGNFLAAIFLIPFALYDFLKLVL